MPAGRTVHDAKCSSRPNFSSRPNAVALIFGDTSAAKHLCEAGLVVSCRAAAADPFCCMSKKCPAQMCLLQMALQAREIAQMRSPATSGLATPVPHMRFSLLYTCLIWKVTVFMSTE